MKGNRQESRQDSRQDSSFRLINIIPHCLIFLIGNVLKSSKGLMGYVISGQVYRTIVSLAQASDLKLVHDSLVLLAAELVLTAVAAVIGELFIMLPSLKMDFAMRMADLESLISRLPQGLDTVIGENGAALSGGEKQRISLARCYMKDSAFLLLDEMTSSVDARTEERLLKKLIKANDKTIICVSHRLAVIRAMNRIIVMKDGEIVEDGGFDDLISKRGYLYQKAVLERDKRSREDDSILWDLHW